MPIYNVTNNAGFDLSITADNELKAAKFAAISENYADQENITIRAAMEFLSGLNDLEQLNDYFGSAYLVEEMKL